MSAPVHDARPCLLGEGPLWHPLRKQLFWCDILGKKLLCDDGRDWQFDLHISALGWIDKDTLLIASETGLLRFDIEAGTQETLCDLEKDDAQTRSNDGRADPWGGFWIGTMRFDAGQDGGAIYRYYKGELRRLFAPVTVSNGIAFAPDKSCAYWGDTAPGLIFRTPLDAEGWPRAAPTVFLDLKEAGLNPDGSVVAADGSYLNAQWGAGRVARYSPAGTLLESFEFPASRTSCPAFGGPEMKTLFVTSAQKGAEAETHAGQTFAIVTDITGLPEYQVLL